ncbi:MAG: hypothetical protein OEX14_03790, partial [Paracoccaceae bacterium]|nr:hypothetical protein [Paracoccaceae bacterium]
TDTYIYFPQVIAGMLKSARLKWDDFWPALEAGAERSEAVVYETNMIDFAYDPSTEKYKVAVAFGSKETVWLTKSEFLQVIPHWVKGEPKC